MQVKYEVSICTSSKVIANVTIGAKQTNQQTGLKQ